MQVPRDHSPGQPSAESDDATTAIPTGPREDADTATDAATEKINARGEKADGPRPRRGGGLSAADLLRREGRI
jgi:RND superfamily putative drug exporter